MAKRRAAWRGGAVGAAAMAIAWAGPAAAQSCFYSDDGSTYVCRQADGSLRIQPAPGGGQTTAPEPRRRAETRPAAPPLTEAEREENRRIQRVLNAAGCEAGVEDGVFGQQSRRAVRCLQRLLGAAETGELAADEKTKVLDVYRSRLAPMAPADAALLTPARVIAFFAEPAPATTVAAAPEESAPEPAAPEPAAPEPIVDDIPTTPADSAATLGAADPSTAEATLQPDPTSGAAAGKPAGKAAGVGKAVDAALGSTAADPGAGGSPTPTPTPPPVTAWRYAPATASEPVHLLSGVGLDSIVSILCGPAATGDTLTVASLAGPTGGAPAYSAVELALHFGSATPVAPIAVPASSADGAAFFEAKPDSSTLSAILDAMATSDRLDVSVTPVADAAGAPLAIAVSLAGAGAHATAMRAPCGG